MYTSRTIESFYIRAASQFPVMLVVGARQVGKTTLLRYLSDERRRYVSLDDPLIRNLAKEDPALFMQRFPPPVLIDEIQYATELLPYIKLEADAQRSPGLFWLTGSQQFHLMKGVSESLAGRVGIVNLLGMSRNEMVGRSLAPFLPTFEELNQQSRADDKVSLKELYKIIWRGSFPAIALSEEVDRELFYSSYMETYLKRDIRDLSKVGNEMSFIRFIRATAARTGQLLNLTELSRDADVAVNTAKNWLSILQASGIVYLLEPFHTNVTKRLVKTPKIYFLDTGLCAWLTEWSNPETLEAGAASGAILETWIMSEILKSWWHNGRRAPLYFYRDKDQKEIDLLIVQDGTVYPLEFKKTASPDKRDVRHFQALGKLKMPVGHGGIICLTSELLPLTPTAYSIPISAI